jgi:hypothetical protein
MRTLRSWLLLNIAVMVVTTANGTEKADQFAAAYARAKTEVQKRSVCINAIDAGVVRAGAPVDVLKKIFGQDFEDFGADSKSNRLAIVHFVPPWRSTNQMVSDVFRGWYFAVTYTPHGAVLNYHLSNVGKESAMAVPSERGKAGEQDTGLPVPSLTPDGTNRQK